MLLYNWLKEVDDLDIILAKTAGFCFGVDRALKKVYDNLDDKNLYTYGPIIHNRQVVDELAEEGVQVIEDLNRLSEYPVGHIIVRSHGISEAEQRMIEASPFDLIDATCPYVKRIHKIVSKASSEGHGVIIAGDRHHPEVTGIAGWGGVDVRYVASLQDVEILDVDSDKTYQVVAQTTFNHSLYEEIINALHLKNFRVIINETICSATEERQSEALEIASKADLMIVIGGKHSSNTRKLYEISKTQCEDTFHIESIEEFELNALWGHDVIGITAGASTPKKLIEEVISNVRNAK